MNERIRQLAEQAGILKEQSVQAKIVKNEDGTWTSILEYPDLEKFAELIVREWLEQLQYTVLDTQELRRDKSTDYQVGWEDGMFDAGETIKNIFGVEE